MTRESTITRNVMAYLNSIGKAIKMPGGSMLETGTPDIIFHSVDHGMVLFEVKREGQKPTAIQEHRMREWEGAGACCFVVRSVADVLTCLEGCVIEGERGTSW